MSGTAIEAGRAFVRILADDSGLRRGLRNATRRMQAWGASMTRMGASIVRTAALGGALPLAIATRLFAQFDDVMRSVAAVTGAVGAEFKTLTELAKTLGATTSFMASQVAEGMLSLGRAGFTAQQIEAAIPAVLALSRATGTELAESADIAGGALRAFEMDASEMARVSDVLTATANGSSQTLTDLGEALKYVAPIAAAAGMTIEQTAKSIGVLANMQIKGSSAGTGIRAIILKLADPAIQKQLRRLGIEAVDTAGNLKPLGDTMIAIGKAMGSMGTGERLALMKELFGRLAAGAGVKLATSSFEKLEAAIDNAGGTANKTAKAMDAGIGGSLRMLMSAAEGAAIAIGEAAAPVLREWATGLQSVAASIKAVVSANPGLVRGIVIGTAAAIGLGAALMIVGGGLIFTAAMMSAIGTALAAVVSPIGLLVGSLAEVGVWFFRSTESGQRMATALGAAFVNLKETAGEAFGGIGDALRGGNLELAGRVAMAGLKVAWLEGVRDLKVIWFDFWQSAQAKVVDSVASIKTAISDALNPGVRIKDLEAGGGLGLGAGIKFNGFESGLGGLGAGSRIDDKARDDSLARSASELEAATREFNKVLEQARQSAASQPGSQFFGPIGQGIGGAAAAATANAAAGVNAGGRVVGSSNASILSSLSGAGDSVLRQQLLAQQAAAKATAATATNTSVIAGLLRRPQRGQLATP